MKADKPKWFNKIIKSPSLRKKLIGFMLLQSVTISVLVTIFSYYNASLSMQKHSINFSTELLSAKTYQVSEYLHRLEQYSQDILYEDSIYTLLEKAVGFDYEDLYSEKNKMAIWEESGAPVINLFSKTIVSRVEIQSLAIYDNEGKLWASQDDSSKDFNLASFLDEDLFFNIRESADGENTTHLYIQEEEGKALRLFLVRRLSSPDTYEPLGYFVMMADFTYFNSLLASSEQQQGYSLILIAENDTLLYQTAVGLDGVMVYLGKNVLWEVDKKGGVLYNRGEVEGTDWTLVAVQDLSVLFSDTLALRNTLLVLTVVTVMLFALLSFAMAKDILKPVERLIKSMKRVKNGETGVNVKVDRQDELGYMSKTFNDMIRENEMLVRSIYRAEITKKDAELQALQSQINPHFLYNTLESISWSARLAGVNGISEMVEDLGKIMEAGVGKSEEFIPLAKEVEYIETYLRIMKRRFEDRLKTKIEIDPEIMEYKVPKLLIQPLVENAIYHGIEKSTKGGFVELRAKKEGCCLIITVTNSGKSISNGEIEAINKGLSMHSDEYFFNLRKHQRKNVGIENVNRRIKLYFGEEYGLEMAKNDEGHTVVTARLHLEGMDETQSITDR